jgi:hypothetical protein
MSMDPGSVSAIISAGAGISGVLLGNMFTVIKEWLVGRSKRQQDTAYLAIIVVSHLNRFADGCWSVALDDGTGPVNTQQEDYVASTQPPEFQPLDIDVEWKVLPQNLMYAILQLPDQRQQIQNRLAGIAAKENDYPFNPDYFWARRRDYAELGLRASYIAQRLLKHAKIPIVEPPPSEWNRDVSMRSVIQEIDEKREALERRIAERQSEL